MYNIFLTNKQITIFHMLEFLNQCPNRECSYRKIAEALDKDKKTIKSYIQDLLDFEEKRNIHFFDFENGILSEVKDAEFHIADLFDYFMRDSIEFKMLVEILENNDISYEELADKLFVSRTKFQSHYQKVMDFLEEYDIILSLKNKKSLLAKEHQIRFFYYAIFWQLNNIAVIQGNEPISELLQIIQRNYPAIDFFSLLKIGVYCYIISKRVLNGHYVTKEDELPVEDHPILSYSKFETEVINSRFFRELISKEHFADECNHLYSIICFISLAPMKTLGKCQINLSSFQDSLIEEIVAITKEHIKINLTPTEEAYLHINLYYLHKATEYFAGDIRLYSIYNVSKDFNQARPKDMKIVNKILSECKNHSSSINEWFENSTNITYLFKLILAEIMMKHKKVLKVFINTKVSSLQQELLENFIIDISIVKVEFMTAEEIMTSNPDCIISDWISVKNTENIPYFNISSQYRSWDITSLESFLLSVVDGKFI